MAITGTARGTGGNSTGATSIGIVPASNCTAGAMVVLCISYDNAGSQGADPYSSISDGHGNTWYRLANALRDPGAASAGSTVAFFRTNQNVATLTTGSTVTISFGSTSVVAKAWTLTEFTSSAGTSLTYISWNSGSGASATPSVTSLSLNSGELVIGAIAREANGTRTDDADTSNGSWSTGQSTGFGSGTSGAEIITQHKVVNASGTQTYNPTFGGASADYAAIIIYFREQADLVFERDIYTLTGYDLTFTVSGATHNVSRTESATVSDTNNILQNLQISRAESADVSDTDSRTAAFQASRTETGNIADTSTRGLIITATVSESANTQDEDHPGRIANVSDAETSQVSDVESAQMNTQSSRAEAAAVSDVDSVQQSLMLSRTEAANMSDSSNRGVVINVSMSESLTAQDADSPAYVAFVTDVEASQVSDIESVQRLAQGSRTETGDVQDVRSGQNQVSRSETESLGASETNSGRITAFRSMDESGQIVDVEAANMTSPRTRQETAQVSNQEQVLGDYRPTVSESAVTSNVQNIVLNTNPSDSETGQVQDLPSGALNTSRSLTENPIISEQAVSQAEYQTSKTEISDLADIPSGSLNVVRTNTETAIISDESTFVRISSLLGLEELIVSDLLSGKVTLNVHVEAQLHVSDSNSVEYERTQVDVSILEEFNVASVALGSVTRELSVSELLDASDAYQVNKVTYVQQTENVEIIELSSASALLGVGVSEVAHVTDVYTFNRVLELIRNESASVVSAHDVEHVMDYLRTLGYSVEILVPCTFLYAQVYTSGHSVCLIGGTRYDFLKNGPFTSTGRSIESCNVLLVNTLHQDMRIYPRTLRIVLDNDRPTVGRN